MHVDVLNMIMTHADDMAAAACAMSMAPQNYSMFIESRDKLKEILQETTDVSSWSPENGDRRKCNN